MTPRQHGRNNVWSFRCVPPAGSRAPARAFPNAWDALEWARGAAEGLRVAYTVWACRGARLKLVKAFRAGRQGG